MADPIGSNVANLSSLLGLFRSTPGKTTNSTSTSGGGTETTQTQMSQEGINALLKTLMEGNSGLAQVASGQKAPGLYNSTSRQLLINDLMSRNAANVAEKTAPVVRTSTPVTKTETQQVAGTPATISPTTALLGAGALAFGTKTGRKKVGELYDTLKGELGFGASEAASTLGAGQSFLGAGLDTGANMGFAAPLAMENAAGNFGDPTGGFWLSGGGEAGMTGMAAGEVAGSGFSFGDAMPYAGSFLQALSGDMKGGAESALGTAAGTAIGGPIGGVVGSMIAEPVISVVNDFTDAIGLTGKGDEGLCFITTAICGIQNKPDDCDELTILRKYRDTWLAENYPESIKQYYDEAPKIVSALKAREDAPVIFNGLYRHYLVPAIEFIQADRHEDAYQVYRNMFYVAAELAELAEEGV